MLKSKEKTYKFDRFGYAQALLDIKKEKQDKINNITSLVVMVAFLGLGLLSKEFILLYLTGKGIGVVTDILVK